jgi:serine O-acetyltransferase
MMGQLSTLGESAIVKIRLRKIGDGLSLTHTCGLFIMPAKVKRNCSLISKVTIGTRNESAFPVLADDMPSSAIARVLGGTHLAGRVKLSACAVVIEDIPARATVVGVPAKLDCAKELSLP